MLIPSEKVIIQALTHDIRRTILKLLQARAYSFSELMKLLNVPSGQLNYHLSQIAGFISKNETNGKYESTILGVKAIDFLDLLEQKLTNKDIPFLCEAYVSQMTESKNIQEFPQSYLMGTIKAINLIQRLMIQKKERGESQDFPNYLSELEARANRIIVSLKGKNQRKTHSSLDPENDYWQGVYDTFNQARFQFFKRRQSFPQFLSRMQKEAIGLLSHLYGIDFELKSFSRSTKIGEDLTEEFSRFETEG